MINPIGSRVIYTERFILRPFVMSDAEMMLHFYLKDPYVCKYLDYEPYKDINEVYNTIKIYIQNYQNPFYFHWAIVDKRNGYVIGSTSIHNINHQTRDGEIGICLSRLYWGRGVGKEILSRVIEFAKKEVWINDIYGFYAEGNEASRRLMISLGMKEYAARDYLITKQGKKFEVKCLVLKTF